MACDTQEEIADREGLGQPQVQAIVSEFSDLKKLMKSELALAEHAVETPSRYLAAMTINPVPLPLR